MVLRMTKDEFLLRKSTTPAFDAVEAVKQWLGEEIYGKAIALLKTTDRPLDWAMTCAMYLAIEGYCVVAWYESVWGEGTWVEPEMPMPSIVVIVG